MAKLQTLQEDWRSGSNVSSLWGGYFGTTSVVSNQLTYTVASGASNFQGFTSTSSYNLTDSYCCMQLISAGDQSLSSLQVYLTQLQKDSSNKLTWFLNQNILQCNKTVANSVITLGSNLAYDSSIHQWFRIREMNGTIYWDYSTDGVGWVNYTSDLVSNIFAVTAMSLALSVGTTGTEVSGTTVIMDAINVIPSNKPSNIGKYISVGSGMARSEMAN